MIVKLIRVVLLYQTRGCKILPLLEYSTPYEVWTSLDPRPPDLCILMEGLVCDDHVA